MLSSTQTYTHTVLAFLITWCNLNCCARTFFSSSIVTCLRWYLCFTLLRANRPYYTVAHCFKRNNWIKWNKNSNKRRGLGERRATREEVKKGLSVVYKNMTFCGSIFPQSTIPWLLLLWQAVESNPEPEAAFLPPASLYVCSHAHNTSFLMCFHKSAGFRF